MNININRAVYYSPLGTIVIESEGETLTRLRFADREIQSGKVLTGRMQVQESEGFIIATTHQWLEDYFAGKQPRKVPRLNPKGTDFQRKVWQVLFTINYGQTMTYGEIAKMVGCKSAQAVGQAIGKNPIVLIIPCHRVVCVHGTLGGYAFGKERKMRLLQMEKTTDCH